MLFLCWRSFRASNPSVRARRLRRSPTEGTPLGVSVDSRCSVSLFSAQFLFWRPYAGANSSVRARRLRRSPTEETPLGVSVDSRCRVSLLSAQFLFWRPYAEANPSVRPIAKQWHEAAPPPKYSRRGHSKHPFCLPSPKFTPKNKGRGFEGSPIVGDLLPWPVWRFSLPLLFCRCAWERSESRCRDTP